MRRFDTLAKALMLAAGEACKPGETAASTGCTPASGEGGKKESAAKGKAPELPKGSVKTGDSGTAKVFRGTAKAADFGGGMSSIGDGRYFGLERGVAELFSKEGTVQDFSVPFESAVVIAGDADLKQIKRDVEETFDFDMGREGNLYVGFLTGDQAPLFSLWLRAKGHDAIIQDYKEGPGGRQLVQLNPPETILAKIQDPELKAKAAALLSGKLEPKTAPPIQQPNRPPAIKGVPEQVVRNVATAIQANDADTLAEFQRLATEHGLNGAAIIRELTEHPFTKAGPGPLNL